MGEAFRGEFYQKVDAKARVSIPATFRRILEADDPPTAEFPRPRLYMIYGGKNRKFIECLSKVGSDWLDDAIRAMPIGSPARIKAERDLIRRSVMVEVEPDGRIVLPPPVRDKIGLGDGGGEALFTGQTDRFYIYNSADPDEDEDDDGTDAMTLIGMAQEERAKRERGM